MNGQSQSERNAPAASGIGDKIFDLFVIGGGVNGCGIARDAAGRGYSVFLAEKSDLASGTSSKATKLIHGGLRYLEYYEFRLVREALTERETLWALAPHLVHPLHFILPYHKGLRPAWMLRLGLFLYDHIGGRKKLPGTRDVNLRQSAVGAPLKPLFEKGFEYSDCWADDARLVIMNARDAADRGACVRTRAALVGAEVKNGVWELRVRDMEIGGEEIVRARMLVNAAGPWVDITLQGPLAQRAAHNVRLVKGSHIVIPKLYDHDRCYIFQNSDGRIIFTIPYEDDFTLIGTTDLDYSGDLDALTIDASETAYLCAAASEYFIKEIKPEAVVWSFAGVRPLYDDHASAAQQATRDYVLQDLAIQGAPLLNIFGGKLTTYRRLSETVLKRIGAKIGAKGKPWTASAPLPGANFPQGDREALARDFKNKKPFLSQTQARRFAKTYGSLAWRFLEKASTADDLGRDFGAGLTQAEIDYLVAAEWARTAEDILWRRTKLGLRLPPEAGDKIDEYLRGRSAISN